MTAHGTLQPLIGWCFFACREQAFVDMHESMSVSNADVLKSCLLFRGFSETGMLLMGKLSRDRNIPAGTPIFVENMVAESLFVIRSGVVRLSIKSPDGRDHPLEKLAPGDGFGELSLLIGGHRMVTASAETDCELLEIPRRDFAKLQKQKPQTCLKLMINIVKQFGKKVAAASEHLKPLLLTQIQD
jgi:CRP/FNR family cyclic AMP-dependent transcriptional regulator